MRKRAVIGLGGVLATAVLAAAPAAAQAEKVLHWYSAGKLLTGSESIRTKGTLTFEVTKFGALVTCKVGGNATLSNPEGGGPGISEITNFKAAGCRQTAGSSLCSTSIRVTPRALPWDTHLIDEANFKDAQEGVTLQFSCKHGTDYGAFFGTLVAVVNPNYGGERCEASVKQCVVFEYEGDTLSGESGTLVVTGSDMFKTLRGRPKISVRQDEA